MDEASEGGSSTIPKDDVPARSLHVPQPHSTAKEERALLSFVKERTGYELEPIGVSDSLRVDLIARKGQRLRNSSNCLRVAPEVPQVEERGGKGENVAERGFQ